MDMTEELSTHTRSIVPGPELGKRDLIPTIRKEENHQEACIVL